MNKTLKKMLATVSAVAVCAVSMTAMTSGAIALPFDEKITKDTISFTCQGLKYTVWEEATDYFDNENLKVFISEPIVFEGIEGLEELDYLIGSTDYAVMGYYQEACPLIFCDYWLDTEEEADTFEEYLSEHGITYERSHLYYGTPGNKKPTIDISFPKETNVLEDMQMLIDIKEDTGYVINWGLQESSISVTDVVNTLPEVTLSGDADCNDKVSIDDVVLIMQSIANPDKYQMTIQGIVNADVIGDGDGVTISDATEIQSMVASHAFD